MDISRSRIDAQGASFIEDRSGCGVCTRGGFSLIELLSVMAVMVMISTIVVSSGFGMRRGATYTAARQIPANVLEYAHQRACMDGRQTAVLFAPSSGSQSEFSASVFQASGVVFDSDSGSIVDKFSEVVNADSGFNVLTIFNFDSGEKFVVGNIERKTQSTQYRISFQNRSDDKSMDAAADGLDNIYYYPYTVITKSKDDKVNPAVSKKNWPDGSAYGFEIAERQILPDNFKYELKSGGKKGTDGAFWVVFNPDGSIQGSQSVEISVAETVGAKKFKETIKIN